MAPFGPGSRQDKSMSKFKIKVARIEAATGSQADPHVCITFRVENGPLGFQVPIHLKVNDYDDTEMVQAARSVLHRMFIELGHQTLRWKLSEADLRLLANMSLRPSI
jgi:hypothetical protein